MRALCVAAAAAALIVFAATPARAALTEVEQRDRILLEVSHAEEQLRNSGMLVGDPALDAYLQEVIDRLFPDRKGELHVRGIHDSEFNAFAMPSGSIYFHTGALLRIQDEAQLASILGHEGTHYTADHAFKQVVHAKHAIGASMVGSLVVPFLADVVAISSMAGFSREHEREADQKGIERMSQCGYDPQAGAEIMGRMDRELTARGITHGGYFWADHPKIQERVASLGAFATAHPGSTERDRERYLTATESARMEVLAIIHRRLDGKLLVFLLDDEKLLDTLPPRAHFYLAEGLRLRGKPGDSERAISEYAATIKLAPDDAKAYQALGIRYMRDGRKAEALALLRQYVALEHDETRTGYARQYITTLEEEKP